MKYMKNFYFNNDHLICSFADWKTCATVCSVNGISSFRIATFENKVIYFWAFRVIFKFSRTLFEKTNLVNDIIRFNFQNDSTITDFINSQKDTIQLLHHLSFFNIFSQHDGDCIVQTVQHTEFLIEEKLEFAAEDIVDFNDDDYN